MLFHPRCWQVRTPPEWQLGPVREQGPCSSYGSKQGRIYVPGQRGHSSTSDDVKFLGNSSAKPGSSKTPAGPEHVSGGAVQGGGTLSIIRLKYRKLPHDTFHITIY